MKNLIADVETSGTDVNRHGILQVAGLIEIDGQIVDRFDYKIKPFKGQTLSNQALEINKLTIEMISTFATPQDVYQELNQKLCHYVDKYDPNDKFFIIGWYNKLDDDFLRRFWENNDDKYYGSLIWTPAISVDVLVMEILKELRPKFENFRLETIARHFGIEVPAEKVHDAMFDAELVHKVYKKLVD